MSAPVVRPEPDLAAVVRELAGIRRHLAEIARLMAILAGERR